MVKVDVSPTNLSAPTDAAAPSMNSTRALSLSVIDDALVNTEAPFQTPMPPAPGGTTFSLSSAVRFVPLPLTVTAPEYVFTASCRFSQPGPTISEPEPEIGPSTLKTVLEMPHAPALAP